MFILASGQINAMPTATETAVALDGGVVAMQINLVFVTRLTDIEKGDE